MYKSMHVFNVKAGKQKKCPYILNHNP